jgi:hypothetical protein
MPKKDLVSSCNWGHSIEPGIGSPEREGGKLCEDVL